MAQLIDAQTGRHLWAQRYDRQLKDIFALQDEVTMKILTSLQVKLTEGEQARALGKGTNNVEAYLRLIQAREYMLRFNKDDVAISRGMMQEVIEMDPEYASAYASLGTTHFMDTVFSWSPSPRESMKKAMKLTQGRFHERLVEHCPWPEGVGLYLHQAIRQRDRRMRAGRGSRPQ